jgi:predicted Zn-dependent protease with MMP-like domain
MRPSRQRGVRCTRRRFHWLVSRAYSALPAHVRDALSNVAVTIEDRPRGEVQATGGALGFYQGTPVGERGLGYNLALPDKVTIYRLPLLAACDSQAELVEEITLTLLHEIGHHFGLDDAALPF